MNGKTLHLLILLSICIIFPIVNVYGHGMGSETFPHVDLDGKQVSLEILSSTNDLAKTSIPIIINHISHENNDILIPKWIRNDASM
ncbi:MAG: hypothetical protein H0Z55_04535 [Nitrosarchaeum sp.]|nr:hypothetical protein [Nitrosarchaeum sp.]